MLGMPHYHKSFDVVHARSCANGVYFVLSPCPREHLTIAILIDLRFSHFHRRNGQVSEAGQAKSYFAFLEPLILTSLLTGGILLVVEGDLQLCAETYDPMEVAYETGKGSWLCRVLTGTAFAFKFRARIHTKLGTLGTRRNG